MQSYDSWRSLFWERAHATNDYFAGPIADPDGDGLVNFAEYAFGLDPNDFSELPGLQASVQTLGGEPRLVIVATLAPGARDVRWTWEVSSDFGQWVVAPEGFALVGTKPRPDGTAYLSYLDPQPLTHQSHRLIRLRAAAP